MSKHTPGPWEAFTEESFSGWWAVQDGNGHEIGSGDGGFDEEDARLMASAPELLEALEEAVCALDVCGKDYRATEIGRAAIAKAKGEKK